MAVTFRTWGILPILAQKRANFRSEPHLGQLVDPAPQARK
jgi:hypothetical protein